MYQLDPLGWLDIQTGEKDKGKEVLRLKKIIN